MITLHRTKFLGIGVPPRATTCPHCKSVIAPDVHVFCDGGKWLAHATFFCSPECLQAGHATEDKTHQKSDGVMMEWSGSGG